jgi:putative transposase
MVVLIGQACVRFSVRLFAYSILSNHFHCVVCPERDGDLSRWMQWGLTTQARRYHRHYGGTGHVWQGRFKAFVIQDDDHLVTVLRYVERNPVRAGLVERCEDWPWSSARWWLNPERPAWLEEGPVKRGRAWIEEINAGATVDDLDGIRNSIRRGVPYGSRQWCQDAAARHGCESTLRPPGRPRRPSKKRPDTVCG